MPVTSFPPLNGSIFPPTLPDSRYALAQPDTLDPDQQLAEERCIAQAHGNHYLLPVFDPPSDVPLPVDPSVGELLGRQFCSEHKLAPIATEGHFIDIAVSSPESLLLSETIQTQTGRHMRPMFAPLSVVERLLVTLYPSAPEWIDSSEFKPLDDNPTTGAHSTTGALKNDGALAKDDSFAASQRVAARPNRYLSEMLNSAIRAGAGSLHFDVVDEVPRVRWRVNGRLSEQDAPTSLELYAAMIQQIKRLAKIDSSTGTLAASGAFNLRRDGLCVHATANLMRSASGEQLVVKLHDNLKQPLDLSSIGLSVAQQRELRSALQRPHGLFLVVGTPHSGRTMTQYACLHAHAAPGQVYCTIEDRISQTIAGALQLSMHDLASNDWCTAFDACAEHEPDRTLVEQLADRELATRCVLAGATNQRVIAGVRATTTLQAIGALRQLGVDHGLVAESLRCLVAQRLVRRLCEHCRQPVAINRELAVAFQLPIDSTVYRPLGCEHCYGCGYVGSTGVFEVLSFHPRLQEAMALNASAGELARIVRGFETVSLNAAVIEKLVLGETSVEEATRVGLLRV